MENEKYANSPGQLASLPVGDVDSIISSPPYATGDTASAQTIEQRSDKSAEWIRKNTGLKTGYGVTEGQLGAMKEGKLDRPTGYVYTCSRCGEQVYQHAKIAERTSAVEAAGASPVLESMSATPSKDDRNRNGGRPKSQQGTSTSQTPCITPNETTTGKAAATDGADTLGESNGERLSPATDINVPSAEARQGCSSTTSEPSSKPAASGIIPYETCVPCADHATAKNTEKRNDPSRICAKCAARNTNPKEHLPVDVPQIASDTSTTQLCDDGEQNTYWGAVKRIYEQCFDVLKPGGVICVVIKAFVKAGKIVPLPEQTWELLQHVGFEPVERVRAMLVKEDSHPGLFDGPVVKKTERKSFFRRLAERKGSPAIDFEEVLFCRKPL
jgi:hypothetical protein